MEVTIAMINRTCWIIAILLPLVAGCGNDPAEPAQLQFISMIPSIGKSTIKITSAAATSSGQTLTLNYASPSGYHTFDPGKYDIRYCIDGNTLLEGQFVLGKNSYQTLLLAGILPDSLYTNPRTTMHTLKKIFAGSENSDANGYMPQFRMLRDLYRGEKDTGMVRLVNASPFARKVTIKKESKKLMSLAYPTHAEPVAVNSGEDPFRFYLGSVLLGERSISIHEGHILTIITGNDLSSGSSLTIATYSVKSESIR